MPDSSFATSIGDVIGRAKARRRALVAAGGIAVVLALIAVTVLTLLYNDHTCGFADDITRAGSECIGITDGSFAFNDNLKTVEQLIADENKSVTQQGKPFVTVAYYVPMTLSSTDSTNADVVRHEIEGAYVAQWQLNHSLIEGDLPLIRLVLANPGSGGAHYADVAQRLVGLADSDQHLDAVAGLGISTANTAGAVKILSQAAIAMIADTITATSINGEAYPGFVQVTPDNSDEVKAALASLDGSVKTALLVQDTNPSDEYVKTLGEEFRTGFVKQPSDPHSAARTLLDEETYNAALAGVANRFAQISEEVCAQKPDVIYFAGRGSQLADFTAALDHRYCTTVPVKILSGDDTSNLLSSLASGTPEAAEIKDALSGGDGKAPIKVLYTALAYPQEWTGKCATTDGSGAQGFLNAFGSRIQDKPGALEDGQAIMAYDAVLTAGAAIRVPEGQSAGLPEHQQVVQNLAGLHGDNEVKGASGPISINSLDGRPLDKPMPLLELEGTGTVQFTTISWPEKAAACAKP